MNYKHSLIVPSIREDSFNRFVKEWSKTPLSKQTLLWLMEDNPKPTFNIEQETWSNFHFCWSDIKHDLKEKSWIIPRRSDTVRSYAYYRSWALRVEPETMMMTLDDDCYPSDHSIAAVHQDNMRLVSRWFNTLSAVKPRGVPFYNLGKREVVLSHGLWKNVLDYDAPTQLVSPDPDNAAFDNSVRIVPAGQYFPMCGMNVAWSPRISVLMYHLLMGCVDIETMPERHRKDVVKHCLRVDGFETLYKLPFDRFGDIWCGILMKKVVDHLGMSVVSGAPYIHHDRASDPFTNLIKEANGLKVNEYFWQKVDEMDLPNVSDVSRSSAAACYYRLGQQMGGKFAGTEYAWYFDMLGEAMCTWAELFL